MRVRGVVPDVREGAGRPVEDDAAAHEHEALDEALDRSELVRDVEDGHLKLSVAPFQPRSECLLRLHVDAGRRLVQHQEGRLPRERLGDEGALLLAAG
jgi:hypothetical protein